jgi:lipid II:glycine glycyltransferase (peptidoglycan interpeptide bridge formation enzyme)
LLDLQDFAIKGLNDFSDSGKRYLNKGKKAWLSFVIADTKEQWEQFYHTRYTTAFDKGFGVISKQEFETLREFCLSEKKGQLFLATKEGAIVSGSLFLFEGKQMTYLYGATDRSFGDIGGHYWLMYNSFCRWQQSGYLHCDLLGIAPFGFPDHHLAGVSRFKQSFGGTAVSYVGNFDLVFNKMLYKGFQRLK